MTAIQDLVLTFCPKMRCVPQRILKLLMPVFYAQEEIERKYRHPKKAQKQKSCVD